MSGSPVVAANSSAAAIASRSAGGIITMPSFRNDPTPTVWPSRRSAMSHRMVASEPVTDRLGPRLTPIRTAPCNVIRRLIALNRAAGDQSCRQIVEEVAGNSDNDARAPSGPSC